MTNGIYVPPFLGEEDDNGLHPILQFLLTLGDVPDVRPLVKKFAGIMRLYNISLTQEVEGSEAPAPNDIRQLSWGSKSPRTSQSPWNLNDRLLQVLRTHPYMNH